METKASYVVVGAFVFGLFAAVLGFVLCFTEIDGDRKINVSKRLLLRG